MNRSRLLVGFLVASATSAADPVPVVLPEAGIALQMQAPPQREVNARSKIVILKSEAANGRAELAKFLTYPVAAGTEQRSLDVVLDGVRQSLDATSDIQRKEVFGRPAVDLKLRHGEHHGFARIVVLEQGVLTLQLVGPAGLIDRATAEAFFAGARRGTSAGQRVTLTEAGVSLQMQSAPRRQTLTGRQTMWVAAPPSGTIHTQMATFTPGKTPRAQRAALLTDSIAGYRDSGTPVTDEQPLTVEGRPAREFRRRSDAQEFRVRMIALEGGLLTLTLAGPAGKVLPEDATAYFDSLQFTAVERPKKR